MDNFIVELYIWWHLLSTLSEKLDNIDWKDDISEYLKQRNINWS